MRSEAGQAVQASQVMVDDPLDDGTVSLGPPWAQPRTTRSRRGYSARLLRHRGATRYG